MVVLLDALPATALVLALLESMPTPLTVKVLRRSLISDTNATLGGVALVSAIVKFWSGVHQRIVVCWLRAGKCSNGISLLRPVRKSAPRLAVLKVVLANLTLSAKA